MNAATQRDERRPAGARPLRVLVVEDAREYREMLLASLGADGFEVRTAGDGGAGVELARAWDPDVVVLDLGLPDADGLEVCRELRSFTSAYVLMLTARDDEVDKIVGLSVGADDYMTKPFSARELSARIRAMARRPRASAGDDGARRFARLTVDVAGREARVDGRAIDLTRTEFDLLDALTVNDRIVLSRTQLLHRVWGENWYGDDHVVDVHMSTLRKKLGDAAGAIETVRGVGYRFRSPG